MKYCKYCAATAPDSPVPPCGAVSPSVVEGYEHVMVCTRPWGHKGHHMACSRHPRIHAAFRWWKYDRRNDLRRARKRLVEKIEALAKETA